MSNEEQADYTVWTWAELKRLLDARRIPEAEIERAVAVLNLPDPAKQMQLVAREDVAYIANYMTPIVQDIPRHSPMWRLIFEGHPAARAIYLHERAEIAAYKRLGVDDPLAVSRPGDVYYRAHARACYKEALYWEAWAESEGKPIRWYAFVQANPLRSQTELHQILEDLFQVWLIVPEETVVELEEARLFYTAKRWTPEGIRSW